MFFDYVYYWICKYYYKHGEKGARISGLALLSLIQNFNLLFLVFSTGFNKRLANIEVIVIGSYIILLFLNAFRYYRLNYDVLSEMWKADDTRVQKRKGRLVKGYLYVSLLLVIILIFRNVL